MSRRELGRVLRKLANRLDPPYAAVVAHDRPSGVWTDKQIGEAAIRYITVQQRRNGVTF